jgi:hypothetical protein
VSGITRIETTLSIESCNVRDKTLKMKARPMAPSSHSIGDGLQSGRTRFTAIYVTSFVLPPAAEFAGAMTVSKSSIHMLDDVKRPARSTPRSVILQVDSLRFINTVEFRYGWLKPTAPLSRRVSWTAYVQRGHLCILGMFIEAMHTNSFCLQLMLDHFAVGGRVYRSSEPRLGSTPIQRLL